MSIAMVSRIDCPGTHTYGICYMYTFSESFTKSTVTSFDSVFARKAL